MRRRALFALAAVLLVFGALEAGAWLAEPHLKLPERTLPLPKPGSDPAFHRDALAVEEALLETMKFVDEQAAKVRDTLGGLPMVRDDATGWGLPADRIVMSGSVAARINVLGLRGPDLQKRAPNEERILTLGDSSIFGDGVAESQVFSSVAAELLSTAWGRPVVGVIGGVPGHDSGQSLARLRQKGAAVEPTWVLVGNMWSDVYKDNGFARTDTAVAKVKGPLHRFATYRVATILLDPWLLRRKVGWIASMDADVPGDAADARSRVLLHDYVANLRAIADEAKKLGARPAFLALPAPIDLDLSLPERAPSIFDPLDNGLARPR